MSKRLNRRDFLRQGGAGLGAALGCLAAGTAAGDRQRPIATEPIEHLVTPPLETVRVGYVGVGSQGSGHVRNAEATWPLSDATAQVPPQVISVRQIETQIASR